MANKQRIKVHFFVSHAHTDDELAKAFIEEFREMSAPSRKYAYKFWRDAEIMPGENWKKEITDALKKCDLGLLLISPAFLGSKFISSEELPAFIGNKAKPMIPVMLKMVNFRRHDLKGLDSRQIFRLKVEGVKQPKSFAQCSSSQRTEFVYELFDQVEERLDRLYDTST